MKNMVYLFAGITASLSGQTVFDFENDSLSGWLQVPERRWERASVDVIRGEGSLHHAWDNPDSGVDLIARDLQYPDLSDTLSVAFRVRHGYPPSSGNNWQLFLLANDYAGFEDRQTAQSAILFGVNYTGHDDHLKLWHLLDGNAIVILDTGLDYQEQIGTSGVPLFRISRFPGGRWEVAWHMRGDQDSLQILGEGAEIEAQKGKYLGFRYAYSSAQDRKLWLDDISIRGSFFRDTVPPRVTQLRILGLDGLEVKYNETVSMMYLQSYSWNGMTPDSLYQSADMHRLYFSEPFPNRAEQELHISWVSDPDGNYMADTTLNFSQELAAFGDIVINEILTDPDPQVYLPGCEYVELYNRYTVPIDLNGWQLMVNSRAYDLRGVTTGPGGFVVLTHPDCTEEYGVVAQQGVLTSATALVNGGAAISLRDQHGRLIHCLAYDAMERYGDMKTDGGWSLERADPDNLCGGAENWFISVNPKGGTPGELNSHQLKIPDTEPPFPVGLGITSADRLSVLFDEYIFIQYGDSTRFLLDEFPATLATSYSTPANTFSDFAGREIFLALEHPVDSAKMYQLILENVSDCAGNILEKEVIPLMLPSSPAAGMPVLNEIMYDPAFGGSDYIELYNQGDRYFDLYDLQLEIREPGSLTGTTVPLTEVSRLLFPGEYAVLCSDAWALRSEWMPGVEVTVIGIEGWKKLPAGGACIRLTDRSGRTIEQVCYHDSMHHDRLQITAGVSLERIDPDCSGGAQCWTSAAASANYGTPGSMNSQALSGEEPGQELKLTPRVFSPDGDGVDDHLLIAAGTRQPGSTVDVYVTDLSGNFIRQIVSMGIAGKGDHFFWNGEDQQGRMVLPGIYMIHQRSIGSAGNHIQREACAVVYR